MWYISSVVKEKLENDAGRIREEKQKEKKNRWSNWSSLTGSNDWPEDIDVRDATAIYSKY